MLGPKFVRERPRAKETGYISPVQPARSGNARRQCSDGEPMRLDNLIAPKRWPWCDRGGRFSALRAGAFAIAVAPALWIALARSEEHTSELQSLMRISYAVFCLTKKNQN